MKIKDIRIRFWWQGYNPREALGTPLGEYEISTDGGISWRVGAWGKTLADVAEWLDENDLEAGNVDLVSQRNGKGGWHGEYILSFRKRVVDQDEAAQIAKWLERATKIQDHVSVPGVGEIKPHVAIDPVHAGMLRGSKPC